MTTCTKKFAGIPFAHRQHQHKGHCAMIHGHNWDVTVTFGARRLNECGFVIDFGDLGELKAILKAYDHALVLNQDDPLIRGLNDLTTVSGIMAARIIPVPDCSCEGLAELFAGTFHEVVKLKTNARVGVISVQVAEDSKNWATFRYPWANI